MAGPVRWGIARFGWVARDFTLPAMLAAGDRLAAVWRRRRVDARSLSLLQAAWCAAAADSTPGVARRVPSVDPNACERNPVMDYQAPTVEVIGSLHDLTRTTKYIDPASDGYYLGVKGTPGVLPLGS